MLKFFQHLSSILLKPERKETFSCSVSAGARGPKELTDTESWLPISGKGGGVGSALKKGGPGPRILPGSPQTTWARAYLENSQAKRKPVLQVFVLKNTTPLASFEVVPGILGELP